MLTVDSARCGVVSGRIERSGIAPIGVKLGFVPSIGGVYPPDLPARIRVSCVPARNRWSSLRVREVVIQRMRRVLREAGITTGVLEIR